MHKILTYTYCTLGYMDSICRAWMGVWKACSHVPLNNLDVSVGELNWVMTVTCAEEMARLCVCVCVCVVCVDGFTLGMTSLTS